MDKCLKCKSACCRYITVRIPSPRSMLDFDNLIWQISHNDVQVFKDIEGWCLLILNPCVHLTKRGLCGVYQERPITCRQHSADYCEYDNPVDFNAIQYFKDDVSLRKYCKKKFKNWQKRFEMNL